MYNSVFWSALYYTKERLSAIPGIPEVKIRKKPILLQEDTIPVIIITPGKEDIGLETFEMIVEYIYEIQISYIRDGNRIYEEDVKEFLGIRQAIRNALYQPLLPGSSTILDSMIETTPAFEVVSGESANYDISGMVVKYKSIEERVS